VDRKRRIAKPLRCAMMNSHGREGAHALLALRSSFMVDIRSAIQSYTMRRL
jgi:hypothetical protein